MASQACLPCAAQEDGVQPVHGCLERQRSYVGGAHAGDEVPRDFRQLRTDDRATPVQLGQGTTQNEVSCFNAACLSGERGIAAAPAAPSRPLQPKWLRMTTETMIAMVVMTDIHERTTLA